MSKRSEHQEIWRANLQAPPHIGPKDVGLTAAFILEFRLILFHEAQREKMGRRAMNNLVSFPTSWERQTETEDGAGEAWLVLGPKMTPPESRLL